MRFQFNDFCWLQHCCFKNKMFQHAFLKSKLDTLIPCIYFFISIWFLIFYSYQFGLLPCKSPFNAVLCHSSTTNPNGSDDVSLIGMMCQWCGYDMVTTWQPPFSDTPLFLLEGWQNHNGRPHWLTISKIMDLNEKK